MDSQPNNDWEKGFDILIDGDTPKDKLIARGIGLILLLVVLLLAAINMPKIVEALTPEPGIQVYVCNSGQKLGELPANLEIDQLGEQYWLVDEGIRIYLAREILFARAGVSDLEAQSYSQSAICLRKEGDPRTYSLAGV